MAIPAVIQPIPQVDSGDCAVAVLAMMLGLSYKEVADHARTLQSKPTKSGLGTRAILAICRHFGHHPVGSRPALDTLDEESGILLVRRSSGEHAVALFRGSIYDPEDGMFYEPQAYLATEKASIIKLIKV